MLAFEPTVARADHEMVPVVLGAEEERFGDLADLDADPRRREGRRRRGARLELEGIEAGGFEGAPRLFRDHGSLCRPRGDGVKRAGRPEDVL
jgi:hypothetical protein